MSTAKAKQAAAATTATPKASKQIEQVVAAGKETIETAVKVSQDAAEAAVMAHSQAFKSYEDAVQATRENVDAIVKAGTILTKGLQDLNKAVVGLTQETIEESVAASKQMMSAKTLRELIDLQSSASRAGFDKLMSESSRLSDLSIKLVEEALAPISDRVNATVDKLVKSAA